MVSHRDSRILLYGPHVPVVVRAGILRSTSPRPVVGIDRAHGRCQFGCPRKHRRLVGDRHALLTSICRVSFQADVARAHVNRFARVHWRNRFPRATIPHQGAREMKRWRRERQVGRTRKRRRRRQNQGMTDGDLDKRDAKEKGAIVKSRGERKNRRMQIQRKYKNEKRGIHRTHIYGVTPNRSDPTT